MSGKRRNQPDNRTLFASETGSVRKKWKNKLPVALIFPNTYQLGMSNLGFQLVYGMLNRHPDIVCERFFASHSQTLRSVESDRPLTDFPVLLISVSFEHDFLGIVELLIKGGIEPLATRRRSKGDNISPGNPLVVCGGVATFINPEPIAPFVDVFQLGELEPVVESFLDYLFQFADQNNCSALLRKMATTLRGCYVPEFYTPQYYDNGVLRSYLFEAGLPEKIKKNISQEKAVAGHSQILTSETEFANIHLAELGRGCSRSCRFCAAGYVYRPPRLWSAESIVAAINKRADNGKRIGLLGMEMANPDQLQLITTFLTQESCSLSFSSLRADIINQILLDLLEKSNLKSAAIAPDGGSERLRKVINKGITEVDCLDAAESLVKAGVRNLKMYFMIGLPTETDEDLLELVSLVKKVQQEILAVGRQRGHFPKISLSINCFVPKAWTPFQFCGLTPLADLKKKISFLRKQFAGFTNLKLNFDQPGSAYFQAVLARGDRNLSKVLLKTAESGQNWKQICRKFDIDPDFYATRQRDKDEAFPWEIIDHGIDRRYLWNEYQRALAAKPSQGCLISEDVECKQCGVCK